MRNILFLCTGNYYRSRFAEEYFNHVAQSQGIYWKAHSRGLSLNMPNPENPGPMSEHAKKALDDLGISIGNANRYPLPVQMQDFHFYDKIIALSEKEHRSMIEARFSDHAGSIEFFEVGDLLLENPRVAMKKLAWLVDQLINHLKQ